MFDHIWQLIIRCKVCFGLAALLMMAGSCGKPEPLPFKIKIFDLSASIESNARVELLTGLAVAAQKIERGASLTLIPITEDALTKSPGLVKRYQVKSAEDREVYDADLIALQEQIGNDIRVLEAIFKAHPPRKSDILGALRLAAEERASFPPSPFVTIEIFSDLIEDDSEFNFLTDARLLTPASAEQFAHTYAQAHPLDLKDVHLSLGIIRSHDLAMLASERREAIRSFWLTFLKDCGAHLKL